MDNSGRPGRRWAILLLLLGLPTGCALTPMMPPLNQSYLQSGSIAQPPPSWRGSAPAAEPTRAPSTSPAPLQVEHDTVDDLTRVSVMTHPGRYFLWIQKPQVTFFYVYGGSAPPAEPPAVVYLVFRTQSPQSLLSNKLTLVCDGFPARIAGLPTSRLEQNYQVSTHFLTYAVPRETFLELVKCREAEVEVGGVLAPFTAQQLADLQGLAAKLQASSS